MEKVRKLPKSYIRGLEGRKRQKKQHLLKAKKPNLGSGKGQILSLGGGGKAEKPKKPNLVGSENAEKPNLWAWRGFGKGRKAKFEGLEGVWRRPKRPKSQMDGARKHQNENGVGGWSWAGAESWRSWSWVLKAVGSRELEKLRGGPYSAGSWGLGAGDPGLGMG